MATHSRYSCLENSMDRGAWQAKVHGVTKSQTQLSMHAHTYITESLSCTAGTNTACKSTVHQLKIFQKNFQNRSRKSCGMAKTKSKQKTNKHAIPTLFVAFPHTPVYSLVPKPQLAWV